MNEVIQALKERRSCRSYKPDPIPTEILDQILEAGTYAPTGMGRQSPIMIAVTDRETRDRLSRMNAAHALGIGSCWIHRAKEEFDSEEGKAILAGLGIQGDYEGIGHCILGYEKDPCRPAAARKENYIYRI